MRAVDNLLKRKSTKSTKFSTMHGVIWCDHGTKFSTTGVWPQQVDLWVRARHVCVGTAACPGTADFSPCAPQAKIYRFVPFFLKKKKKVFIG